MERDARRVLQGALIVKVEHNIRITRIPLIFLNGLHLATCAITVAGLVLEAVEVELFQLILLRCDFLGRVGVRVVPFIVVAAFGVWI